MRVKLGLVAASIVSLLVFAAPAAAQSDDPSADTTEAASDDTTSSSSTSASSTTTTTVASGGVSGPAKIEAPDAPLVEPGVGDAPAEVSGVTPTRGTQLQIVPPPPPPPPPTTQAPWDPFRLPANSGSGRRAVYSKSQQTVWAFDSNNNLIKQHRVSGKQAPLDPRPGIYRVWSRSRHTYSINNPSITWGYMVRFAKGAQGGNIGFHEIPFQYGRPVQSLAQLGQPLSGGCVRQALPDAQWMWSWAQLGTLVVVTP